MSFQFNRRDGTEYDYDEETECIIYIEMVSDALIDPMHYETECSECGGQANPKETKTECPNCGRDIIDWEGR